MSTIKSSTEHLTLNADGSGKDIKFQANGVEVASISSTGSVTCDGLTSSSNLSVSGSNGAGVTLSDGDTENGGEIQLLNTNNAVKGLIDIVDGDDDGEGAMRFLNLSTGSSSIVEIGCTDTNGRVLVKAGGAERMHITSSGTTDIKCYNGTSSSPIESRDWPTPALALRAYGNFTKESMLSFGYPNDAVYQTGNDVWNLRLDGVAEATTSSSSTNLELYGPGDLRLGAGGAERMRITSDGGIDTRNGGDGINIYSNTSGEAGRVEHYRPTTGTVSAYYIGAANSLAGYISCSATTTTYVTSSDYRLKEDDQPMVGSIDRLKLLRPINFAWKVDGTRTDGFLAHEAGEVVPECATGTKDAMRDEEYEVTPAVMDGDTVVTEAVMGTRSVPDYQGIDQSKLVPLLVASLQEAVAKIEALEARVTALEV